jgi:acyl-CoA thioester hydrolase
MTVSYHAPIRELGEVSVDLWVDRVGKTSADFRFAIRSADKTVLHAEGKRVSVRLDAKTHRPAPWSDEVRRDLTALIRPSDSGDEPGAAIGGRTPDTDQEPGPRRDVANATSTAR